MKEEKNRLYDVPARVNNSCSVMILLYFPKHDGQNQKLNKSQVFANDFLLYDILY